MESKMTDTSHLTNDLTTEQLQRIIANHESGVQLTGVAVYRQLLAAMQREAKLREALLAVTKTYPYERCKGKKICKGCKAQIKAEKALASCEYPAESEK